MLAKNFLLQFSDKAISYDKLEFPGQDSLSGSSDDSVNPDYLGVEATTKFSTGGLDGSEDSESSKNVGGQYSRRP